MKSAALIPFAILFCSITLPAQNATYGVAGMQDLSPSQAGAPVATSLLNFAAMPHFCPVSLRVQHGASGGVLQANKSLPKGPAQLLHITLINPDSRQIVSARFAVRGASGKPRVAQALTNPGNADADTVRTLEVPFSSAPGNTVTGNLWVPGMTAVLTIELTSVTFADGSKRTFTPQDACRVAPDLKMLIAAY